MSNSKTKLFALTGALALFGAAAMAQVVATNEHLPHFHQIGPAFYRGAQPTQKGFELLARQGVKTIINLRAADEKSQLEEKWTKKLGLRYYNLPLKGRSGPTDAEVQAVLSAINAPENQP